MAVQKSKKSRSKRDMRRRQNSKITMPTVSIEQETGEKHLRHHMTPQGYYRGRKILTAKVLTVA